MHWELTLKKKHFMTSKRTLHKIRFTYPEDKLIELAKAVKDLVDGQAKFPDWNKRDDIKSALKVGLILFLDEFGYPQLKGMKCMLRFLNRREF